MPNVRYVMGAMSEFIYALFDSRMPKTVHYVGRTKEPGNRFIAHCRGQEEATKDWAASVRKAGAKVRLLLLEAVTSKSAEHREKEWIAFLRPPLNRNCAHEHLVPDISEAPLPLPEEKPPFDGIMTASKWLGLTRNRIITLFRHNQGFFCEAQNKEISTLRDPALWSERLRVWLEQR